MTWPVGMMLPEPAAGGAALTNQAEHVERLGFDWISCGEHVLFTVPVPNAFVTLAHVAAVTTRVELLAGVTIAPLYPPGLLAKLATTLDVTSGGRLNLGIGTGGEFPAEFAACGVPVSERGRRTDEALELLRAWWDDDASEYQGRFVAVQGRLRPRPVRRPPIWVGGRTEPAIRRTARFGDVWFPYLVSSGGVARGLATLRRELAALGRDEGAVRTTPLCFVSVDEDDEAARQSAASYLSRVYGRDFTEAVDRLVVAGSPERCVETLQRYAAAGSHGVVLSLVPGGSWPERLALLHDTVLPEVRRFRTGP